VARQEKQILGDDCSLIEALLVNRDGEGTLKVLGIELAVLV
jgi:hypothetical protein